MAGREQIVTADTGATGSAEFLGYGNRYLVVHAECVGGETPTWTLAAKGHGEATAWVTLATEATAAQALFSVVDTPAEKFRLSWSGNADEDPISAWVVRRD